MGRSWLEEALASNAVEHSLAFIGNFKAGLEIHLLPALEELLNAFESAGKAAPDPLSGKPAHSTNLAP